VNGVRAPLTHLSGFDATPAMEAREKHVCEDRVAPDVLVGVPFSFPSA